jgi:esterase
MNRETAPTTQFIELNGLKIHYLCWGARHQQTIVLLHGLRGYAYNWNLVARALSRDYRILALDQRGRGDSDWSQEGNYYTSDYVTDLEQFVNILGLGRFVLIGHSMGGINAVAYAADHPDRVIATVVEDVGPWPETPHGWQKIAEDLGNTPLQFSSWDDGKIFLAKQWETRSRTELEERTENSLKILSSGMVTWKYDIAGIARARSDLSRRIQLWPYVQRLQCPTLVLRGEHSDVLSSGTARQMAECNINVTWEEIPAVGHLIHDHSLDEFLEAVSRFLTSLPSNFSS